MTSNGEVECTSNSNVYTVLALFGRPFTFRLRKSTIHPTNINLVEYSVVFIVSQRLRLVIPNGSHYNAYLIYVYCCYLIKMKTNSIVFLLIYCLLILRAENIDRSVMNFSAISNGVSTTVFIMSLLTST